MQVRLPEFSRDQLEELKTLGLLPEQIEELKKRLVQIQWWLKPGTPIADIRGRWQGIAKPLLLAKRELTRMRDSNLPEGVEAAVRLADAAADHEVVEHLLKAIANFEEAIIAARAKLPAQRRSNSASAFPIRLIDKALLDGFTRHHPAPMPPYLLSPSRSGPFARVAGICYQAAGRNVDPDRAIRKYLKEDDLRKALSRRQTPGLFGSALDLSPFLLNKKPGRPRGSKRSR
jgi:hypothetical protein